VVVNQRFGSRAATIFWVEVLDQGDVSTALVSNHQIAQRNDPENHDL
jgi:hypothetical protein